MQKQKQQKKKKLQSKNICKIGKPQKDVRRVAMFEVYVNGRCSCWVDMPYIQMVSSRVFDLLTDAVEEAAKVGIVQLNFIEEDELPIFNDKNLQEQHEQKEIAKWVGKNVEKLELAQLKELKKIVGSMRGGG